MARGKPLPYFGSNYMSFRGLFKSASVCVLSGQWGEQLKGISTGKRHTLRQHKICSPAAKIGRRSDAFV